MPWLINVQQLEKFRKSQKNLLIFDASWHMPSTGRDSKAEFNAEHIAGAHFFDITLFNDANQNLPHHNMVMKDIAAIGERLGRLGIRKDCKIVFYDNSDLHTACRALWLMKLFGHNPQLLYILDGGLASFKNTFSKTQSGEPVATPRHYDVQWQGQYLRDLTQMKMNEVAPTQQVLDVRHPVRFAGGPEDRANVRRGHIPQSYSFPYYTMFDKNKQWKPLEKIRQQLLSVGINSTVPAITSCGTGMTAPILNFLLDIIGCPNNAVYNGSWAEWGAERLYDGETSLAERPVVTAMD